MRREVELRPEDLRKEARCPVCKIPSRICVCDEMPRFELPYRFWVLRHAKEFGKQSNTGSLVPKLLPGSRLLDWGLPGERLDRTVFADPGVRFVNLFPLATASPLTADVLEGPPERPLTFVVLDATWSKARRMLHRVHEIQRFPFYSLPLGAQPDRVLRKAPSEERYSTLDAVIRAVDVLGDRDVAVELRSFMDRLYGNILNVRGRRSRKPV